MSAFADAISLPDPSTMTPAQRMTAGLCPECSQDVSSGNPLVHMASHWNYDRGDADMSPEARVRRNMLRNYQLAQGA